MTKGKNKFLVAGSPAGNIEKEKYTVNRKHYAKVNRDGTVIRIRPQRHKILSQYLISRMIAVGPLLFQTKDTQPSLEFFKKENWNLLAKELKIGVGQPFIQITAEGNFGGLILANESMKKEVMNGVGFISEMNKHNEATQKKKSIGPTLTSKEEEEE